MLPGTSWLANFRSPLWGASCRAATKEISLARSARYGASGLRFVPEGWWNGSYRVRRFVPPCLWDRISCLAGVQPLRGWLISCRLSEAKKCRRRTDGWRWLNTRRRILPLLGERVGVRAGVATNVAWAIHDSRREDEARCGNQKRSQIPLAFRWKVSHICAATTTNQWWF